MICRVQVDSADPPFPRPAGYWWFGCRAETKGSYTSKGDLDSAHTHLSERQDESRHKVSAVVDVDDIVLDGGEDSLQLLL